LECAPDKPTNHEKDYEYDCQREGSIVAACPAGRVHVTQDVSPGKWSAAPKKKENSPARRSADGTSASALAAQRKCKTHVPLSFFEFSSVSSEENRQPYTDWPLL
jgi:hypothetical protein